MSTTRLLSNEQRRKAVERTKKWKAANPEKRKAQQRRRCPRKRSMWYLKSKYGLTQQQYAALLKFQGFVCAICKTDAPSKKIWNVDHDHRTEKVRGLLCSNCNWLLGQARDDTGVLTNAIAYLQRPPANAVLH